MPTNQVGNNQSKRISFNIVATIYKTQVLDEAKNLSALSTSISLQRPMNLCSAARTAIGSINAIPQKKLDRALYKCYFSGVLHVAKVLNRQRMIKVINKYSLSANIDL